MKKYISFLIVILVPFLLFSQDDIRSEQEIAEQTNKFKTILQTAVKYYKDTVNVRKISDVAFNAMLKELDNFSSYFTIDEYKGINDVYKGSTLSTGLSIISLNDTITVTAVAPASPASEAEIFPGDKILFVNGVSMVKVTGTEANNKLNQSPDTIVSIIVKRGYSNALNEFNLKKREVTISTIAASYILPGTDIGYIKFIKFSSIADKEFRENLSSLKQKGMKSLILDLRANTGGFMEQVVKMSDDILGGNDTITYTKARAKEFLASHKSTPGSEYETLPIVIIIDGNSASASEILSGAVQDLDRGLVVGTISFGKGSVQKFFEFKDGSAFRITVASYFTPSGRSIQKHSATENYELPATAKLSLDDNTQKSIEDMIKKSGGKMQLPVYKTSKGRAVFGGGGIFPDYFVSDDSTTKLHQVFKSNGLYLDFSHRFLFPRRDEIMKKYSNDFVTFYNEFKQDEALMQDFIEYCKSKKVWNESMYQTDKKTILSYVKGFIMYSLWGDAAYYLALSDIDNQIIRSVQLIPDAAKFVNR